MGMDDAEARVTMPACLHFCWIGRHLGWVHVFAVLSAAERCDLPEIVLHHTDTLAEGPILDVLRTAPRVRLSAIAPVPYLTQAGEMLGVGSDLAELYGSIEAPVKRADILRAAILYREGGLYLDLDTVTVAALTPLIGTGMFVGSESIVWPVRVRSSPAPLPRARALALDLLRKLLRWRPDGWRAFRRMETLYFRSVTNAAMGADRQAPFLAAYLRAMVALPPAQRTPRCALGPHLLQRLADGPAGQALTILAPQVFHPFAPEISDHWFRPRAHVALGEVVPAATLAVHWYASVRSAVPAGRITPETVLRDRDHQFYSALVWACIGHLLPAMGEARNQSPES